MRPIRPDDFPDVQHFLRLLQDQLSRARLALCASAAEQSPVAIARAPGRLDVMGGIADYSGSLVLELPLAEATLAAVQQIDEPDWHIASAIGKANGQGDAEAQVRCVTIPAAAVGEMVERGYEFARQYFAARPDESWAAYVAGVGLVLMRQSKVNPKRGLLVRIWSAVPEAQGVSSSAALEVAAMHALTRAWKIELDGLELARLCQMAENLVVGAPCGIMDQMTAALGKADHLLALLCQPAEIKGFVRLPPELRVWGIASGVRHAVSGSDYTSVRVGAFMGYRIIAELAGLEVDGPDDSGVVRVDDPRWHGYLANVEHEEFEQQFAPHLPRHLSGAEFLQRYGGTTDRVTRVEPGRTYAVYHPAAHPIYEHARVRRFAQLLAEPVNEQQLTALGELMYGSHESYSACGLGSEGTDLLVELVRGAGPQAGLYGAKITGGGSGGTVAVLGRAEAGPSVEQVAREYSARSGRETYVFSGSSPGACLLGGLVLD